MAMIAKCHKWLAMIMSVALLIWAVTGWVFLIKPGYEQAYQPLMIKAYPLQPGDSVQPRLDWLEYRILRSVLGLHLLVRTESGWHQIDVETGTVTNLPSALDLQKLLQDAVSANPRRYGLVDGAITVEGRQIMSVTDTATHLSLDWNTLKLRQVGDDTRTIKWLYQLHYLQWSGHKVVDKVVAVTGLIFLVGLVLSGLCLLRPKNKLPG